MVLEGIPTGYEIRFLIDIGIVLGAGFAIGAERESRNKPAGISTHCLVIGGAMIFTFLSSLVDVNSSSRIAAQVVSGIGFLGAGIILKSEVEKKITNLTTAAAIWYAAAIGMAIGYQYYFLAAAATAFAVGVPRIPHISKLVKRDEET
ncbi:MAG TPA: MgtC/SapB family protein [Nitrososphaera sp.]|jgi:putative Mg2+ transporter-C (MgtC) family protein|nr:MgtC/SapB family protein [Nitrososphaera sp.]